MSVSHALWVCQHRHMNVVGVDPRDTVWEVSEPAYRVSFWRPTPLPAGIPTQRQGWACDEYEITDADVTEVLSWAQGEAPHRGMFTLYARIVLHGEPGEIHLAGNDPTVAGCGR